MGTLVRSCFSFCSHADISPLGCGSPLYSTAMTLNKIFILLLNFMLVIPPGLPCICQVVIALSWVLLTLLSLMSAFLTLIINHIAWACLMSNKAEPFYISFVAWFPICLPRGDFPLSVVILHMFPCIEHRYVPLLGTIFFAPWHLSPPRFVTIKHFYSFSNFSKYFKKSKKIKKPKSQLGKDVISGNSRVVSPLNRALYITSVGWINSLTLGDVLVSLSLSPPTG